MGGAEVGREEEAEAVVGNEEEETAEAGDSVVEVEMQEEEVEEDKW